MRANISGTSFPDSPGSWLQGEFRLWEQTGHDVRGSTPWCACSWVHVCMSVCTWANVPWALSLSFIYLLKNTLSDTYIFNIETQGKQTPINCFQASISINSLLFEVLPLFFRFTRSLRQEPHHSLAPLPARQVLMVLASLQQPWEPCFLFLSLA